VRRPPQLAHTARRLRDSGTSRSNSRSPHRYAEKAMREDPAPEEGAELALDEAGQPHPVGARGGRGLSPAG